MPGEGGGVLKAAKPKAPKKAAVAKAAAVHDRTARMLALGVLVIVLTIAVEVARK